MCCSERRQQRLLLQQDLLQQPLGLPYQPRQWGCCYNRQQRRLLDPFEHQFLPNTPEISQVRHTNHFDSPNYQRPAMAAMLVVGLGLGAEKLGRKISEKRLERKAKKAAEVCYH